MSALWAAGPGRERSDDQPGSERAGASVLQAVPTPPARLSRAPFLLVLIGVFGLGMAGLLMLNTTLQNQTFTSRSLDRQATELTYTQAALEDQIDQVSAPTELARRASALGMRPNPYPAFLVLPSGTVVGTPRPVSGNEVPSMVIKTPAQLAAEKARAEAKAKAEAAAKAKADAKSKADAKAKAKAKAKDGRSAGKGEG